MLDMYKPYWRVSRWIATRCQAKLEATPEKKSNRSLKSQDPIRLARKKLIGLIEAATMHADRLREGHMQVLDLFVQIFEQRVLFLRQMLKLWTRECRGVREPSLDPSESVQRSLEKLEREIKAVRVAVAPLPFHASEVVEYFEKLGHKSQLACKKLEDSIYRKVIRQRKRYKRPQKAIESDIKHGRIERPGPPPYKLYRFGEKQRRRGNDGRRFLSTSSTPPEPRPPTENQVEGSPRHDAPATGTPSTAAEEEDATTTPPTPPANPLLLPSTSQLVADHWQAPDPADDGMRAASSVQALFARKRRTRLAQRALVERSLARIAANEVAFIAHSLQHARLLFAQTAERAVATWPPLAHAISPLPLDDGVVDGGDYASRKREGWVASHATLRVRRQRASELVARSARAAESDEVRAVGVVEEEAEYLEAEMRRLAWRVAAIEKRARAKVDGLPVSRAAAWAVARSEEERSMEAFRVLRARLVGEVKARMEGEERGWRRWRLVQHLKGLRGAEMGYLEKVVEAVERETASVAERATVLTQQVGEAEMMRRRGVVNKEGGVGVGGVVRLIVPQTPMGDVMRKRADQVWELARDLESMLKM